MKKNPCGLLYCALIAAMLLTACLKPGGAIVVPGQPTTRITLLKEVDPLYADSFRLYYNSQGNPTRIIPTMVATGRSMWLFRYDNQQRLNARIGSYLSLSTFEMAYRYVHDATGRIIRDTAFAFGTFDTTATPVGISGQQLRTTTYQYDSLNRIVHTVTTDLTVHPPTFRTTVDYSYNSSGNAWKIQSILEEITSMGIPTDTTITYPVYDNKTNFHRLHPLWQFIDRDYSRNNSGSVSSYNSNGLPTELPAPTGVLGIFFHHTIIRYQ
ncbi:hypothetical protein HHL17_29775 [Chitinophaga sp. G-6-1-13]|uniref:YD repeat-containing protein n=1 Tax=Chitinophaga fulva TaxID=2728842 RepID=A0A848GVT3_9BACT|nr:hypothetical protein [Chitinophaga fulva]NML41419.1 hypothetical protein [Chitinophaga fulva]